MSTPKYSYYIEVPPFEMIIQKGTDEGMEEVKQMIKDDSVSLKVYTGRDRKITMNDEELKTSGDSEWFNLTYSVTDDLITPNGVKAEILENNQLKVSVTTFIFNYQPESFDDVLLLEPQVMDIENLFQVEVDGFDKHSDTIISYEGLRGLQHKWTEKDWSSDEDPLPEIEYETSICFTRLFATYDHTYEKEIEKFGSIQEIRKNV